MDFEANARDGTGIDWPIRYEDIALGMIMWSSSQASRVSQKVLHSAPMGFSPTHGA